MALAVTITSKRGGWTMSVTDGVITLTGGAFTDAYGPVELRAADVQEFTEQLEIARRYAVTSERVDAQG